MVEDALREVLPEVARRIPRAALGCWPTPVEPLGPVTGTAKDAELWVKREDLSSPDYGGNKVRCLETVFAGLRARGVQRAWTTGAWGSNQALGTAIHARRAGLEAGAILFPQPASPTAADNLAALLSVDASVVLLPTVATFPAAAGAGWMLSRVPGPREAIIAPGAATPLGAIGHVGAALEVALAVDAGVLPAPRHVILPVGSTCTTAGLLIGFAVAEHLGLGFPKGGPRVHAVRVTPWPVTARWRILSLARNTARLLHERGGPAPNRLRPLGDRLIASGAYLGAGYGRPTEAGREAIARFAIAGAPGLDTTYAAKAGAYLLDNASDLEGPVLFWSTKSSAPLPPLDRERLSRARGRVRRWLAARSQP